MRNDKERKRPLYTPDRRRCQIGIAGIAGRAFKELHGPDPVPARPSPPQPRPLQHAGHRRRRVHVGPESPAPKAVQEIQCCHDEADGPPRAGIAERHQPFRAACGGAQQAGAVRVAANDPVEGHRVGHGEARSHRREVGVPEVDAPRMSAPLRLGCSDRQVCRRGIHLDRVGEAVLQEDVVNRTDAPANIQQDRLLREGEFPYCREHLPSGRVGAAAIKAPQIAPRDAGIELLIAGLAMTVGHQAMKTQPLTISSFVQSNMIMVLREMARWLRRSPVLETRPAFLLHGAYLVANELVGELARETLIERVPGFQVVNEGVPNARAHRRRASVDSEGTPAEPREAGASGAALFASPDIRILRRRATTLFDDSWIPRAPNRTADLLNRDLVLPRVAEVEQVVEALTDPKTERSQWRHSCVPWKCLAQQRRLFIGIRMSVLVSSGTALRARPSRLGEVEGVKVLVVPVECLVDHLVKVIERVVTSQSDRSPDSRRPFERHLEHVDLRGPDSAHSLHLRASNAPVQVRRAYAPDEFSKHRPPAVACNR